MLQTRQAVSCPHFFKPLMRNTLSVLYRFTRHALTHVCHVHVHCTVLFGTVLKRFLLAGSLDRLSQASAVSNSAPCTHAQISTIIQFIGHKQVASLSPPHLNVFLSHFTYTCMYFCSAYVLLFSVRTFVQRTYFCSAYVHVCVYVCSVYVNVRANYNSLTTDICQVNISDCQVRFC